MVEKRAIITGVSGQDGYFLAKDLLKSGFNVLGLTRSYHPSKFKDLENDKLKIIESDYSQGSLEKIILSYDPAYIYHLAGQSYVGKSWTLIQETIEGNALLTSRLLEILKLRPNIKFFNASSSEIFSDTSSIIFEDSSKEPVNPYGCAKLYSYNLVNAYRANYGVFAINGILFNHESHKRSSDFFSQKIVQGVIDIYTNKKKELFLGNLSVVRDWGDASEYMSVIPRLMALPVSGNYNICSGIGVSVGELVDYTFSIFGIPSKDFVRVDANLVRDNEKKYVVGSNTKIFNQLGWKPSNHIHSVLKSMTNEALKARGLNEIS